MSNMRVKLFLELVNKLAGPAKRAQRDLQGVKKEADRLGKTRGGEQLERGLKRAGNESRRTKREVAGVVAEARKLNNTRAGKRLADDLRRAGKEAARTRQELDKLNKRQPRNQRQSGAPRHASAAAVEEPPGIIAGGRGVLAAAGGVYAARLATGATVGQSISFEKAMAEVRKKLDGMDDPAELAKIERLIVNAAIAYGRSREEIAGLVAEAGATGVSKEDMPEFLRITMAAATAWDAPADQTSQALAKIRAATQWTNQELEQFVDKVNALSDSGSAKEMDVVEMFQRAGAAAKAAGVEFDTSLAFLTAMNNVAIVPEVASRGFAAFASTLRTARSGGKKRVGQGLKMLGLSSGQVEKGMRTDALKTMLDVLERLQKHPDQASAAIKIFGEEWWDEIARAGQALPEIMKNLEILKSPANWQGSAQKNLNIELGTTANHLERLKTLATEVGDRMGRWALPGINEQVQELIDLMGRVDERGTFLQRLMTKIDTYYRERARLEGRMGENGLIQIEPAANLGAGGNIENKLEETLPWLSGRKWNEWLNDWVGGSAEDAEAKAKASAEADHAYDSRFRDRKAVLAQIHERERRRRAAFDKLQGNSTLHFGPSGPFGQESRGIAPIGAGHWPGVDINLGSTITQQLQEAADSAVETGATIRSTLAGTNLAPAGQAMMSTLAAGIRAGGAQAVAEAEAVARRVQAVSGRAGGGRPAPINGALHDGVD
ncbi:TP901 family phage tail tape measure protein [Chelatococcus caeni]|uniref:TP901 family phage tail tape measure protein n=1 Tax=Chelatococcus caeni TaxID=1348468 RepID=A0A840BWZ4_9HYPH|nr:phage tail tape measure protein [Chelatococcus caeni]MBB4017564.1 TP901 family phage tail tape measure protein [Chelatococcus caeni]